MSSYFFVLVCGLGCLTAVPPGQANKNAPNNVIHVELTGILSGPLLVVGDAKDKTYSGAVFAGGRELFLDCAGNKAAKELLQKAYADRSKHTGYAPTKHVQVKGRLQFRPYVLVLYDATGKQIERADTFPVIVVESLKFVE